VEDEFYQPGLIDQTSYDKNLAIKVTKTNLEVRISKNMKWVLEQLKVNQNDNKQDVEL